MQPPTTITLTREPGPLARSLTALVLRAGLGLIFLMFGLSKFQAIKAGKYPAMIIDQFANSPLKPELVKLFADVLPYAETGLGALLISESLHRAAGRGWTRVILVGDEPYYRRFGFTRDAAPALDFPPPTNPDRLLARALVPGAFEGVGGMVRRWGGDADP